MFLYFLKKPIQYLQFNQSMTAHTAGAAIYYITLNRINTIDTQRPCSK